MRVNYLEMAARLWAVLFPSWIHPGHTPNYQVSIREATGAVRAVSPVHEFPFPMRANGARVMGSDQSQLLPQGLGPLMWSVNPPR